MTFDVGTSQWASSVRTSDTKIELSVCTMKTCETCQSVLKCKDQDVTTVPSPEGEMKMM